MAADLQVSAHLKDKRFLHYKKQRGKRNILSLLIFHRFALQMQKFAGNQPQLLLLLLLLLLLWLGRYADGGAAAPPAFRLNASLLSCTNINNRQRIK